VALADIIKRIETQGVEEAERIEREAAKRAVGIGQDAARSASQQREESLARAERRAESESATIVAAARLAARDQALARKRAVVEDAIHRLVQELEGLPAEQYARFIAGNLAKSARAGDTVYVSAADAPHAKLIADEIVRIAPELDLEWSVEPAEDIARGVVVRGDRVRSAISPESAVDAMRAELELKFASMLFAQDEG
jgi:vacuolar-type H+-ATPase subunit E/Vma4